MWTSSTRGGGERKKQTEHRLGRNSSLHPRSCCNGVQEPPPARKPCPHEDLPRTSGRVPKAGLGRRPHPQLAQVTPL